MNVGQMILLLEKHNPATPLVLLRPDLDFGTCMDVEGLIEATAKRYPDMDYEWDMDCKKDDPDAVKVLLVD